MKKTLIFMLLVTNVFLGQTYTNYSDELLASSFKLYQAADFELSYHIFPFLKERFVEQLRDTSSFGNPYDSLSKYIGVRNASDNLLKTYSWSKRDSGCCHSSVTFAQFKTKSGAVKFLDLKEMEDGDEEVFIIDVQMIEIQYKPYYLILGWGTCCGGKHYSTARVYEIRDDSLHKCDSMFNAEAEIYVGANRGQKMELKYSPELKILSYNSYKLTEDTGFYQNKKTVVKWELTKRGFQKVK